MVLINKIKLEFDYTVKFFCYKNLYFKITNTLFYKKNFYKK